MHTIINGYNIELDLTSGLVVINNVHKAYVKDMTIFEEYVDDYPAKGSSDIKNKLELFKVLFEKWFSISIRVYERSYYKAKGIVIYVENDAFPIFELCFPTYSDYKKN